MENKLNTKDLMNIGIFTAIYFIVFFVTGMIGYIPVLMVVLPFLLPITGGIPFLLYLTKVKKFGMITISGVIISLLMFATGHGWPIIVTGITFPFLADLVFKSGKYSSWKKIVLGYCVFSCWIFGALLPMWIMRDSYFAMMREGYGDEYTNALMGIMTNWLLPIMFVLCIVGAFLGALIGRSTLKKHFQRAGIA